MAVLSAEPDGLHKMAYSCTTSENGLQEAITKGPL